MFEQRKDIVASTGVARRITDVVAFGVRYEMKSVREFRTGVGHQLYRDLRGLLAQMPMSPGGRRWVFDANQLYSTMDRSQIIASMRRVLRQRFGDHPRRGDLENWLETIVVIW